MGRTPKFLPANAAIMEWFEAGNIGTKTHISEALNIHRDTVALALKQLSRTGMAKVIDRVIVPESRGKLCTVWSECEITWKPKPVDVNAAINGQPELVRILNSMVER